LEATREYVAGEQNGPQVTYYENGGVEETVDFLNGQPNGIWNCFEDSGELIETRIYESGVIID
jgi:antitoxin component YwqK of YwqJK toxin-antitoxin module